MFLRALRRLWLAWWQRLDRPLPRRRPAVTGPRSPVRLQLEQLETRDHASDLSGALPFAVLAGLMTPHGRKPPDATAAVLSSSPSRPGTSAQQDATPGNLQRPTPEADPQAARQQNNAFAQRANDALFDPLSNDTSLTDPLVGDAPTGGGALVGAGFGGGGGDFGGGPGSGGSSGADSGGDAPAAHPEGNLTAVVQPEVFGEGLRLQELALLDTNFQQPRPFPTDFGLPHDLLPTFPEIVTPVLPTPGPHNDTPTPHNDTPTVAPVVTPPTNVTPTTPTEATSSNYGATSLVFEENIGQGAADTLFQSRGPGATALLKKDGLTLLFQGDAGTDGDHFQLRFAGANADVEVIGAVCYFRKRLTQ